IWDAVFALTLVVGLFTARLYALKVQNRVIRLEERLRLLALLPEAMKGRVEELTESQLIALRFASDDELPDLTERALKSAMGPKEIKAAIKVWRPDYYRV